jgi:hypothetical protein
MLHLRQKRNVKKLTSQGFFVGKMCVFSKSDEVYFDMTFEMFILDSVLTLGRGLYLDRDLLFVVT